MSEIVLSSSGNSDEREINEYQDESNDSSGDSSSSDSSSSDKQYLFGVPGVPLKVLQGELRRSAASGSFASLSISVPASISSLSKE